MCFKVEEMEVYFLVFSGSLSSILDRITDIGLVTKVQMDPAPKAANMVSNLGSVSCLPMKVLTFSNLKLKKQATQNSKTQLVLALKIQIR